MITNTRESMLSHESQEYINSRPDWVFGKIPDLSDYRKLSVDSFDEAFTLARLGQEMASGVLPTVHGKPLRLTFTQALIVGAAVIDRPHAEQLGLDFEKYRSVLMVTPSRYGKSFLNAIACIIMAGGAGKEINIGGATKDKAGIIQNKIVQLLPDTIPAIQNGLVVSDEDGSVNKKIQRLATQTSKESLMWQNGGSIKSFSTNEGQKTSDVQSAGAIGIGGDYCVFDEIQLMSPVGFRTASRFMMEGPDTKRFCVGNPQINGHFKDLYDDPGTFVIHINDITAIVEGRMTRKGFELTDIPTYSNEYRAFIEVEFPDEKSGTRFFSTMPDVYDEARHEKAYSKMYFMGIDSAYKGADGIIVTLLSLNQNGSERWVVVEKQIDMKKGITNWEEGTTFDISLQILKLWEEYGVVAGCIDIGFGIHIYEQMLQIHPDLPLEPINFSEKPTESRVETDYNAKYAFNKRAEMHLDMKDLCENHILEVKNECYEDMIRQMREVGNTPEMNKTKIEPKKKIKERLGRSPDNLDSACLAVHAMVLSGAVAGVGEVDDETLMEFL